MADAVAGRLHLTEVDAEIASAGAYGGRGEDMRPAAFLLGDLRFDPWLGGTRSCLRCFDRGRRQLFRLRGGRLCRAVGNRYFFRGWRGDGFGRRVRPPFRSPRARSRSGSGRRLRPPAGRPCPRPGDSISTVALSVIMSAICWSSSIVSPTLTCQATISASAMPSPMSGSLNSYFAISRPSLSQAPSSCASDQGNKPIRRRADRACPSPSRARPALRDDRSSAPGRGR